MQRQKRTYISIFTFIVIAAFFAAFVSFVIAQEDPDLAPFDATVSVTNEAPFIASVTSRVNEAGQATTIGIVDPVAEFTVSTSITFLIEDNNGRSDITGATVQYTGPAPGNTLRPAAAVACSDTTATCGAGCTLNQKRFECTIALNYYDDPSIITPSDNWDVDIRATDLGGLTAICSLAVTSGCGAGVDTITGGVEPDTDLEFVYNVLKSLTINTNCPPDSSCSASWTGISLTGTNQIANSPLRLLNKGNVLLNNLEIIPRNLEGATTPTETIPTTAFSVSANTAGGPPPQECDITVPETAFQLPVDNIAASIGGITAAYGLSVPYGAPTFDSEDAYFCIHQSLQALGLSAQAYNANLANSRQWRINVLP